MRQLGCPLTSRQSQVLAFLHKFNDAHQRPPTRLEIAKHFHWSSPNAAEDHLRALDRKGAIDLVPGTARWIVLRDALENALDRMA